MEFVILLSPVFDLSICVFQTPENMLVQAPIPEPRVERLDDRILVRLTWRDQLVAYSSQSEPV